MIGNHFLVTNTYNTNIRCKIFEPIKKGKGKLVYLYITQNQMHMLSPWIMSLVSEKKDDQNMNVNTQKCQMQNLNPWVHAYGQSEWKDQS